MPTQLRTLSPVSLSASIEPTTNTLSFQQAGPAFRDARSATGAQRAVAPATMEDAERLRAQVSFQINRLKSAPCFYCRLAQKYGVSHGADLCVDEVDAKTACFQCLGRNHSRKDCIDFSVQDRCQRCGLTKFVNFGRDPSHAKLPGTSQLIVDRTRGRARLRCWAHV